MATLQEVKLDKEGLPLEKCAEYVHLTIACETLLRTASGLMPNFTYSKTGKRRRVFMVNSTAQGGGVAEMLPRMIQLFRNLHMECKWFVITPTQDHIPAFFEFTKRMHNLIHGYGSGTGNEEVSDFEQKTYTAVTDAAGKLMLEHVRDGDIIVLHDPQPLGMVKVLRESDKDLTVVFRCHIGLDTSTPETRCAWQFLKPYALRTHGSVFSLPEYVPSYLKTKLERYDDHADYHHNHQVYVIPPALDPLSHKNRELPPPRLTGVLCNSGLSEQHHPVLTPAWEHKARRLQYDGVTFADTASNIGAPYNPIVLQVSRWDKLKGWKTLIEAFTLLKKDLTADKPTVLNKWALADERHMRRLKLVRLVLAGPDPNSVADDPEGKAELQSLCEAYKNLPDELKPDVALVALPMESRKLNALMVNALQRCSSIVVQNSLREGFGLTVTEAMFKGVPILGTQACGIRKQVVDGVHGKLVRDSTNAHEIAVALNHMLRMKEERTTQGLRAQRRVLDEFTVFSQVGKWLTFLAELIEKNGGSSEEEQN